MTDTSATTHGIALERCVILPTASNWHPNGLLVYLDGIQQGCSMEPAVRQPIPCTGTTHFTPVVANTGIDGRGAQMIPAVIVCDSMDNVVISSPVGGGLQERMIEIGKGNVWGSIRAGETSGNGTLTAVRTRCLDFPCHEPLVPHGALCVAPEGCSEEGRGVHRHGVLPSPTPLKFSKYVIVGAEGDSTDKRAAVEKDAEIKGETRFPVREVLGTRPLEVPKLKRLANRSVQERIPARENKGDETVNFMGVSKHKKSGRYEAHVWVPAYGKQVYLGGFGTPVAAACAHDLVAIKVKKTSPTTNFSQDLYSAHITWIQSTELPEIIAHIKRQSRSFTRGHSKFRGVSQNANGSWEARIGAGANRHLYLGAYRSEESAARHYDEALVRLKGTSAATNYSVRMYPEQIRGHERMKKALAECPNLWDNKDHMNWIKDGIIAEKANRKAK